MRLYLKAYFILCFYCFWGCSKITKKIMKEASEEAVENSSEKTLKKLSRKFLLDENSTYVGDALKEEILKRLLEKR